MVLRLRHWGLTVPQVVVASYLATAVVAGIGLLVMSVEEDMALLLVGMTVLGMGIAALVLQRVDIKDPSRLALQEAGVEESQGSETQQ